MNISTEVSPQAEGARVDSNILVLVAHPQKEQSRVNRQLELAARAVAAKGPGSVVVRDLYALYPDYLIDVAAEQAALSKAQLLVWQLPVHWYGPTPLLKLWMAEVLAFGWAYGPSGEALRGKDLWLVASTGGPEDSYHPASYNRYFFDAFMPPLEQTAALCGMRFLPPLVLHGAHRAGDAEVQSHAAVYSERLATYPHWPELEDIETRATCDVPVSARPQPAVPAQLDKDR